MFGKALAACDAALGKYSAQSVPALRGLGTSQVLEGRYADAEAPLRAAITILLQHGEPGSLAVASTRTELGHVLRLQHRIPEALTELQAAYDAFNRTGATDRGRAAAAAELAETQLDAGDADAALASAQASLVQAREALPKRHYLLAMPLFALARVEIAKHRYAEAEPLLREALAVRSPVEPPSDPRVMEIKVALVDALEGTGQTNEAHALREDLQARLRASHTPYATDLLARLAASAPPPSARRHVSAR